MDQEPLDLLGGALPNLVLQSCGLPAGVCVCVCVCVGVCIVRFKVEAALKERQERVCAVLEQTENMILTLQVTSGWCFFNETTILIESHQSMVSVCSSVCLSACLVSYG